MKYFALYSINWALLEFFSTYYINTVKFWQHLYIFWGILKNSDRNIFIEKHTSSLVKREHWIFLVISNARACILLDIIQELYSIRLRHDVGCEWGWHCWFYALCIILFTSVRFETFPDATIHVFYVYFQDWRYDMEGHLFL